MGFFRNLFGDMKARGLVLPALLLVGAAIAAPFLLSTEPDPVIPPPAEPANETAPETVPWVVAGIETGSRDYQERLKQFKSTNPFDQLFPVPEPSTDDDDGGNDSPPADVPVEPPPDVPVPPVEPPPLPSVWVIDVDVGNIDREIRSLTDVEPFTILPNERRPVFAYIDATPDGLQAVFSISSEAEVVGDREFCAPSPEHCVYLVLERGNSARVQYPAATEDDPDTPTYRLKLRAIRAQPAAANT